MYKNTKQYTAERQQLDEKKIGYYELAVCFAAAQAQEEELDWENFIDNPSYICDKFASHIKSNNVAHLEL